MWLLTLLSCASSPPGVQVVTATSTGWRPSKPPLKVLRFNLSLTNPDDEPRWLVWPSTFPHEGRSDPAPGGDVYEVHVCRLSEHPRVVMVDAVGAHFQAVKLPAHGALSLRGARIDAWWDKLPEATTIEVQVVRAITVGGTALEAGLGIDATSETGADVAAPTGASDPRAGTFWELGEAGTPVTFDVASRSRIDVRLDRAAP